MENSLRRLDTYRVQAEITTASLEELLASNGIYPDWISERYLQLPDDFSQRVQTLAKEITTGKETPYDKAVAINQYLRENYSYSETVPLAPPSMDIIEWFLFEQKQGFCSYFASAEVLLLRSVGIPARFAIGYSEGESTGINNSYIVREKNSHAWPEIYFSGIGWVEFEPTSSEVELARYSSNQPSTTTGLATNPNAINDDNTTSPDNMWVDRSERYLDEEDIYEGLGSQDTLTLIIKYILYGLGILIVACLSFFFLFVYRVRNRLINSEKIENKGLSSWKKSFQNAIEMIKPVKLSPMEKLFRPIPTYLHWFQKNPEPNQTPSEQVQLLTSLCSTCKSDADQLLLEYMKDQYSRHPVNIEIARKSAKSLRNEVIAYRLHQIFRVKTNIS
jgi:hypothetical protein